MNADLERILNQTGQLLHALVESEHSGNWTELVLDVRYDGRGGFWSKIRVATLDQSEISLKTNNALDLALIALDDQRKSVGQEWFGIRLTLLPPQRCNVEFNYNANCSEDASFFGD